MVTVTNRSSACRRRGCPVGGTFKPKAATDGVGVAVIDPATVSQGLDHTLLFLNLPHCLDTAWNRLPVCLM